MNLIQRIKRLEEARTVAAANSLATMMSYEDAIAKIKRLEEAGDRLADPFNVGEDDIKRWNKAKEDKLCIKQLKTKSCIYCMKVECECSDFDVSADMGAKG